MPYDFMKKYFSGGVNRLLKKKALSERIKQVDLQKASTIAELMDAYSDASIQARNLGQCCKVFGKMLLDRERPTIMLGLAGPLIAAGLRKVIRDLISYGMVDVVVSTGAILYQDYYQAKGFGHYKGSADADDGKLRDLLIDRIYDTYVDEEKFCEVDTAIGRFAGTLEPRNYSSREFIEKLSGTINDKDSILVAARKKGIPIFCPAIADSSIGIGLTENYYASRRDKTPRLTIDTIRDNYELTQIVVKSKRTSAFYVAGGVPKNYINDSVVMAYIFGRNTGGHKYAIQVTADSPHWGGLSGSTLKEATSWGKINKQATRAMAFVEPSVSLPLIAGYALQKKLYSKRKRIEFDWNKDILAKLRYVH